MWNVYFSDIEISILQWSKCIIQLQHRYFESINFSHQITSKKTNRSWNLDVRLTKFVLLKTNFEMIDWQEIQRRGIFVDFNEIILLLSYWSIFFRPLSHWHWFIQWMRLKVLCKNSNNFSVSHKFEGILQKCKNFSYNCVWELWHVFHSLHQWSLQVP